MSEQKDFNSKARGEMKGATALDKLDISLGKKNAGGGTRTHTTLRSLAPKASASANSATPACC